MKMKSGDRQKNTLRQLLKRGVRIPCPESVEIGNDIDPERISGEGVTIHAGCKIYGPETLILPGAKVGYEAPATIQNCQLGRNVDLKGGFFYNSCFLDGASMASCAQVREACLLEEGARGAHTVGLKHTILLPFVTLGSLVNFCDCLMSGGTDKNNHSEVGSSYIHFNYTPNQDKATASLIGDVPNGVMINQPPVFLGGQGGMVGPVRIGYGTVIAAGTIVRKDMLESDRILLGHTSLSKTMSFHKGLYTNVERIITLNVIYISNLIALRRWYLDVRFMFVNNIPMDKALLEGAVNKLDKAISERLKRFGEVAKKMPESIGLYRKITSNNASKTFIQKKQGFFDRWPDIERALKNGLSLVGDLSKREAFLSIIENAIRKRGKDYLKVIKGLKKTESSLGTNWLQGLVNEISSNTWEIIPGRLSKK